MLHHMQSAAAKAPKLTKEEALKLRQSKDPNFGKGKGKRKAPAQDVTNLDAAAQHAKRARAEQVRRQCLSLMAAPEQTAQAQMRHLILAHSHECC